METVWFVATTAIFAVAINIGILGYTIEKRLREIRDELRKSNATPKK